MPNSKEDFKIIFYIGLSPMKSFKRLPVVYRNKPLMPMKVTRVRKFVNQKLARIRFDRKLNLHYLELLKKPSDRRTQVIRLGVDPGGCFDGFSVVSKTCHHLNYELIQRPKKGKNSIKSNKQRQSQNRRVRRSRLWHRKIRFDNRTSEKMSPTIRANNEFRRWLVKGLLKYYPIRVAELEDVRFNHYNKANGSSFSQVEIGKKDMERFFTEELGLKLVLTSGYETSVLRKSLNKGKRKKDPKVKDKGSKEFNAHCIDSYVLGCLKSIRMEVNEEGEELKVRSLKHTPEINTKVIYIEKIVKVRRCLTRTRKRYKDGCRYYRLKKGGVKVYYQNFSSHRNVCRVKPLGEHSNHPKSWVYIDNGFVERFKHNTAPYGGTVFKGDKKFFKNNEWNNRKIEVGYG